jgi:BirA family biotin operon repressor/biotin-[acetyl-CoA-carboxylase] ligase
MMPFDGEAGDALAVRWDLPACVTLDRVSSTLDVVHEMAAAGAEAGLVVLADEQVAGRGRQGRAWLSPPGRGIWLGYLRRPADPEAAGPLSLRIGIIVAQALDALGADVRLKWPNDLVLADRKLGGILCEARWPGVRPGWVAVGVGLNVHGPIPPGLERTGIALDHAVPGVTRLRVLDRLVPALGHLPERAVLDQRELTEFHRRDWLRDRRVRAPLRGVARGVGADGSLLVETDDGRVERVVGGSVVAA